jgi:hypothetical protein
VAGLSRELRTITQRRAGMSQLLSKHDYEILIINNRCHLDEDFGTPEEHLTAMDRDWEACMTFNGICQLFSPGARRHRLRR